jgi:enterochelin esterase-like enzyme
MKVPSRFVGRIGMTVAVGLAWISLCGTACVAAVELTSPRLARLAEAVATDPSPALLATFWAEREGKGPLIEPGARPEERCVTFLWRGADDTTRVTMIGGMPAANLLKPLARLPDTDVWFLTETHSAAARFQYVFQINGPATVPMEFRAIMQAVEKNTPRRDPMNPHAFAGWSFLELENAVPQPWIERRPGVPVGELRKLKFPSELAGASYPLTIYLPPGYAEATEPAWLLVAFDGGFRLMDATLDNLRAAGKIPAVVVVGVGNLNDASRNRDLGCSETFRRMLVEELVPWARKNFRVHSDAAHTIVGGTSLGGKMATYCGLKSSNVFGKVLSQSGSFLAALHEESPTPLWEPEPADLLAREFVRSPRLPLEFYLEVGRYETTLPFSHLLETRRLRDVLEAKGYRVTYAEFIGGHNEVCWRGTFADAIIALTGRSGGR